MNWLTRWFRQPSPLATFREELTMRQRYMPPANVAIVDHGRYADLLAELDSKCCITIGVRDHEFGRGFYFDGVKVFSTGWLKEGVILWR